MSNYVKLSKQALLKNIRCGVYKTSIGANRAIGKSSKLTEAERLECKAASDKYFSNRQVGQRRPNRPPRGAIPTKQRVGAFLHLKSKLEYGLYRRHALWKMAIARAQNLTKQERTSLLNLGQQHFEKTSVSTAPEKKTLDAKFHTEQHIAVTLKRVSADPKTAAAVSAVVTGAMASGMTLPVLNEVWSAFSS